ncbi:MAG TPA: hypothetical protein VEL51_19655 [Vicinamibacterales bacterium]|nr:hypothetical protein [Vicinamibacterales bacterium]
MFALGTPLLYTVVLLAQAGWSASAGRESFSYRDIARSRPPADASPVAWVGSGPSLFVVHERANARRAHRFNIDLASAGSFEYAGPIVRSDAPSADRAFRVEGRYEYRRYVLRDRVLRGLDAALGIQGIARRLSLTRRGVGTARFASTGAGVAGVAAARLHRWSRWSAELAWTNGLTALREHDTDSIDPLADVHLAGGSWLTDFAISASAHLSKRASLTASWLRTGEGHAVSHHNYAFSRQRMAIGVTYDR